jgi:hypothetical protein|uniref:Uncharacterized protein n=1 Tax=viral metagenome TaxID=1070528 RepID=A0A6C0JAQ1_9ZZZZ
MHLINSSIAKYKKLCTPASVYLLLSIVSFIVIVIQNIFNPTDLCVGIYGCPSSVQMKSAFFTIELIYIFFWTWILSLICNAGYKKIAWLIVLFPIILMFIVMGSIIFEMNK